MFQVFISLPAFLDEVLISALSFLQGRLLVTECPERRSAGDQRAFRESGAGRREEGGQMKLGGILTGRKDGRRVGAKGRSCPSETPRTFCELLSRTGELVK